MIDHGQEKKRMARKLAEASVDFGLSAATGGPVKALRNFEVSLSVSRGMMSGYLVKLGAGHRAALAGSGLE